MRSDVRRGATSTDFSSPGAAAALLRQARALAGMDATGLKPLLGQRLALVSSAPGDEFGREFEQAARALGALVTFVQPELDERSSPVQVESTARLLGRLYDAVECQHLPAALVARIAAGAAIPVFCGLALPGHPTAVFAEALDASLPLVTRRRQVLQAALLLSLG